MKIWVFLLVSVILSGCSATNLPPTETGITPAVPPSEEVSLGPVETPDWGVSSDEVSGAAEQLVGEYLDLTDQIGSQGAADPTPIAQVVTDSWLVREREGFAEYRDQGIRTLGTTSFDHFDVQSARFDSDGLLEVAVFICVDSTRVLVLPEQADNPPKSLVDWFAQLHPDDGADDETLEQWADYSERTGARTGFREPIVIWMVGETARGLRIDGTENWRGAHPC